MSVYRIICVKKLDIAMNLRRQRRITNKLIGLEWITLGVLSIFFWTGVVLKGQTNFIPCSSTSGSEMIVVEFPCIINYLSRPSKPQLRDLKLGLMGCLGIFFKLRSLNVF